MTNSSSPTPSGSSRPPRPQGQPGRQWEPSPNDGHIPGYPKPEDGGPVGPGWSGNRGRGGRGGAAGPGPNGPGPNNQGPYGAGPNNQGPNGAGPNNHGPGGNRAPQLPKPPKVGRPDGLAPNLKGAPENVRLGVRAWLAVSGLQILYALIQFFANLVDDRDLRRTVTQTIEQGNGVPEDVKNNISIDTLVMGTNVLTALWMIAAALICAWLTMRAGRGAVYSRMFLNVGSIYLMITAVLMSLSSGPPTMAVAFVLALGVVAILSGVGAGVGMWFMSRPGNEDWFGIPSREEVERYAEKYDQARRERDKHKKAKNSKNSRSSWRDKANADNVAGTDSEDKA